jgi:YggT family protein
VPAHHNGLIPARRNEAAKRDQNGESWKAVGGAERDRTADLLIANEALSQLSYGPNLGHRRKAVSGNELGAIYGPSGGESRMGRFGRSCGPVLGLFSGIRAASFRLVGFSPKLTPMRALFLVIDLILQAYIWLLIAAAVLSWLVAFNVVNARNQVVAMVGDFLYRITEPLLRPIRSVLPDLGGIDISPVVLILIIIFIRYVIALYILPNVF